MPPEAEYHAAALDMLGAAPERERMLPERAVRYPAAVVEWFLLGQLEALEVTEQRLRVAPGFYVYVDEGDDPPVYHDDEGLVSRLVLELRVRPRRRRSACAGCT